MNESKKDDEGADVLLHPGPTYFAITIKGSGDERRILTRYSRVEAVVHDALDASNVLRYPYIRRTDIKTYKLLATKSAIDRSRFALSGTALRSATDWFPSPKTRKLLKKLVSDQLEHVDHLVATRRVGTARWQWCWTWLLLFWYGGLHAASGVARAMRGMAAEEPDRRID